MNILPCEYPNCCSLAANDIEIIGGPIDFQRDDTFFGGRLCNTHYDLFKDAFDEFIGEWLPDAVLPDSDRWIDELWLGS